ncbi:MAG: hypothetical protein QM754_15815 [Tepidisphaeraceae bacterium]
MTTITLPAAAAEAVHAAAFSAGEGGDGGLREIAGVFRPGDVRLAVGGIFVDRGLGGGESVVTGFVARLHAGGTVLGHFGRDGGVLGERRRNGGGDNGGREAEQGATRHLKISSCQTGVRTDDA